jgi:hypothetical protein
MFGDRDAVLTTSHACDMYEKHVCGGFYTDSLFLRCGGPDATVCIRGHGSAGWSQEHVPSPFVNMDVNTKLEKLTII